MGLLRSRAMPDTHPPSKPTLIQALGDKRMAAILFLGFASGLPLNLTGATLQAWLAYAKVDIKTIGLFTLAGFPYFLKFLWAPVLDRVMPPFLGRRRGWILIFQLCVALGLATMAFGSPTDGLSALGITALIVAFMSASQDIVIDAYRVDVIPPSERALAAAATTFGYRSGAMFASAVIVMLAEYIGWRFSYLLVACLMALTMIATVQAPEPATPGQPPRTLADAVVKPWVDLFDKHGALGFLALVLLYKVGDAFALSLYSAFMVKGVGLSPAQLGLYGKVNMTVSTVIGVGLGGWIYMRWGMFRSLLTFGVGQAFTNLLYMWLAITGKKLWLVVLATSVDTMVGGMGQAAYVAFLVSLCSSNFSAAQYALLSAMSAVPRVTMGAIAGRVVDSVGWAHFFVITFLTAIPGLALLLWLRQPLNELEARETAKAAA
jgi:MFS transporter, PAT family, beta-lactamase induction signal transducer AmpG